MGAPRRVLGPQCVGLRVVVRRRIPGESGPSGGPALTDLLGVLEEWGDLTLTIRTDEGAAVRVDRADLVAGKPVPPRPSTRLRVSPAEAERRAVDTWPPLERASLGDWVLRASRGFSRRGNSALLVGDPGLPWDAALDSVAAFYLGRDLPVLAQVVAGSPEEERLLAAGWQPPAELSGSRVEFRMIGVAALRRACQDGPRVVEEVSLQDTVSDAWLADDLRALSHGDVARAVLEGPAEVTFAAVTSPEGRVVAAGRAALSERADVWLGLSDVRVAHDQRGRGHAARILLALAGWGAERGATTAYLQSRSDNAAARSLYDRLGFALHHEHCYVVPG